MYPYQKDNFMTTEIDKPKQEKKLVKGGAREGSGRPKFVPTDAERQLVATLSGRGLPQDQIAILVRTGIHIDTLRTHFHKELLGGKANANSKIGGALFDKALDGDTTAMIWWTKSQMRWAETQKLEHSGVDGAPITIAAVNLKGLNDQELEQMQLLLQKTVTEE